MSKAFRISILAFVRKNNVFLKAKTLFSLGGDSGYLFRMTIHNLTQDIYNFGLGIVKIEIDVKIDFCQIHTMRVRKSIIKLIYMTAKM